MELQNKKIMIIAPHMDDEIIGCAGTILKYRDIIKKLIVVHITNDKKREEEFKKIKDALKIDECYNLDLKDGFVNSFYKLGVLEIIKVIQKEKPDIVFIPHQNDYHRDHISTNLISLDAIEKARYWETNYSVWHVNKIYEYEVWKLQSDVSEIVEISDYIENKKELMKNYTSQLDFDYLKFIECINGYRGIFYNKKGYAECFHIIAN